MGQPSVAVGSFTVLTDGNVHAHVYMYMYIHDTQVPRQHRRLVSSLAAPAARWGGGSGRAKALPHEKLAS
eukprot:471199-Prymnesium_polylepis.1